MLRSLALPRDHLFMLSSQHVSCKRPLFYRSMFDLVYLLSASTIAKLHLDHARIRRIAMAAMHAQTQDLLCSDARMYVYLEAALLKRLLKQPLCAVCHCLTRP